MKVRFVIFFSALLSSSVSNPIKLFGVLVTKPVFSLENSLLNKVVRPVIETPVFHSSQGTSTPASKEVILFPDDPLLGEDATEVQTTTKGSTTDQAHTSLQVTTTSTTSSTEATSSLHLGYESTSSSTITEPFLANAEEEVTTQKIIVPEPERFQVNSLQTTTTASENVTPYTDHVKPDDTLTPSPAIPLPAQDEATTSSSKPAPVPVDGGRVIFDVPNMSCPEGTRRSARGQCRKIYS